VASACVSQAQSSALIFYGNSASANVYAISIDIGEEYKLKDRRVGSKAHVTSLTSHRTHAWLAVGCADGTSCVWDYASIAGAAGGGGGGGGGGMGDMGGGGPGGGAGGDEGGDGGELLTVLDAQNDGAKVTQEAQ
jgi:hypothetical protein